MAKRLFGTDGIRGTAGQPPLDPRTVTALGIALAEDLEHQRLAALPVFIAMDTRESGPAPQKPQSKSQGTRARQAAVFSWFVR